MATRYADSMSQLDIEKGGSSLADFADRTLRAGFMRKVFGLLAVQLAITTVLGAFCVFSPVTKAFLFSHPLLPTIAFVGAMVIMLTFSFSESARSSHPTNLILLFTFTLCEGLLVGLACTRYSPDLVVTAFGMTAAVSTGLAIYAMRTKTDFTMMGGMLYSMLLSFVFAIVLGALFHVQIMGIAVSLVGAALFSAYLVYDIQLLMGGQHQHKISPDDYVMATISIYLDIINLFLYILRALAESRRE